MAEKKKRPEPDDAGPLSFEAAMEQLETIVQELEQGELPLSRSLARYEQGVKCLKHCYRLLEEAERKIELLSGVDADGNPITKPLSDEATMP